MNSYNNSGTDKSRENRRHSSSMAVMRDHERDGIELQEIVSTLRGGKWAILATVLIVLSLSIIYAIFASPVYQANGLIQIQEQSQSASATDVLSLFMPIAEPAQTEIGIMTSRSVLEPVVNKLHLNIELGGSSIPIISKLFGADVQGRVLVTELRVPDDWKDESLNLKSIGHGRYVLFSPSGVKILDGSVGKLETAQNYNVKIKVQQFSLPSGKSIDLTRLYDQEALDSLEKNLSAVETGKDTGIVKLTFNGKDPQLVSRVLNAIESQYIKQNIASMAMQAHKSLAFVGKQLPQIKKNLDHSETKLTAFLKKNGAIDLDQQSQTILQQLSQLQGQVTQLEMEKSSIGQQYTSKYPAYKVIESQEKTIQKKIEGLKQFLEGLPQKAQKYMNLQLHVKVYQQLYSTLLAKMQDLEIAQAGTVGSARIVDHAVIPIKPIAPNKVVVIFSGMILGLFVGIVIVFVRRALNHSIEDVSILEDEFDLPVYAVIPHSQKQAALARKADKDNYSSIPLLSNLDSEDPAIESLRGLKTGLSFALRDKQEKVISICGCAPSAGKSFLSINFAHILSDDDAHILLIDSDMRRGHLERYLTNIKSPGLSDYLSRKVGIDDIIQHSPYSSNIDFIASGEYPSNPYELTTREELKTLINQCSKEYDYVIIDVPPILSVADAGVVAGLTTTNFLVVRSGHQRLQEVRLTLKRFEQNGSHVIGFILNDLSARAQSYSYGKYGGAYKRYRYSAHARRLRK